MKKHSPNINVMMSGRCGNQLFQYAYGRNLQLQTAGKLYLDFCNYDFNDKKMVEQGYVNVLEDFNVADYIFVDKAHLDKSLFARGQYEIYFFLRRLYSRLFFKNRVLASVLIYFLERIISVPLQILMGIYFFESANSQWLHLPPMPWHRTIILSGFFESDNYFKKNKDVLEKELLPKVIINNELRDILEKMNGKTVTCMSVRRGDFASGQFKKQFLVCDEDYYRKAVSLVRDKHPDTTLLICSDDVEWCKENLHFGDIPMIYEPLGLTPPQNLFLRMHCDHFILSNSTFSWWGQELSANNEKMVVAPRKWRKEVFPPKDIYCDNWILL